MFYRLSNTATRIQLERMFHTPMQFPGLYMAAPVIDGLMERNITIRTQENMEILSHAIWGILPHGYSEQWQTFQNIRNTLNLNADALKNDKCFKEALYNRRCIILVTGFFTTYLINSVTYPYYVHLDSQRPFGLAGVYNRLDDGFLTASFIVSDKANTIKNIQNLCGDVPLVLDFNDSKKWLSSKQSYEEVNAIIDNPKNFLFKSFPISKEFYNEEASESEILNPYKYSPHIMTDFY